MPQWSHLLNNAIIFYRYNLNSTPCTYTYVLCCSIHSYIFIFKVSLSLFSTSIILCFKCSRSLLVPCGSIGSKNVIDLPFTAGNTLPPLPPPPLPHSYIRPTVHCKPDEQLFSQLLPMGQHCTSKHLSVQGNLRLFPLIILRKYFGKFPQTGHFIVYLQKYL